MKGTYIIKKYSAELIDGEWVKKDLVDTVTVENDITFELAQYIYNDQSGTANSGETIIAVNELRLYKPMSGYRDTTRGWVGGSQDATPTFFPAAGMDDAYWEHVCIVNPPVSGTRNIRSVCLTTVNSGDTQEVFSIAALSAPCPQTSTEILQITYRLTLDLTTIQANSDASATGTTDRFQFVPFTSTPTSIYSPGQQTYANPFDSSLWGTGIIESVGCYNLDNNEILYSWTSNSLRGSRILNTNARFGNSNSPTAESEFCGLPIKSMGTGKGAMYSLGDVGKGTTSSVQNTYGRSAYVALEERPPFLDNNYIATSAASVNVIDQGNWANMIDDSYNMPYVYRITIETGGNVGTATYKLRRRRIAWVYANTNKWQQNGLVIPTFDYRVTDLVPTIQTSDDNTNTRHGQVLFANVGDTDNQRDLYTNRTNGDGGTLVQRYLYPEMLCFDYDGITIHAATGEYVNFDTNSTPALNVTEVLQVASDGSTIYVADASSGLYMIQRDFRDYTDSNATITQISPPGITDTTSCRGVTTGYEFQEGIVTNVRVNFGGSNYAVADTVTIAGANGTGATAEVASVDADGAILTVKVTDGGSGYIYDHISAYVSSGNGVGASLDVEVGTDLEVWALFDDTTDGFMYLAHGTKVGSDDYTSLNFDTTGDTITRTGGTDFLVDGFRSGQKLFIKHAEDSANNGVFTITNVTSTVITVSENLTTNTADTTAQLFAQAWEIMTETISDDSTSYNFNGAGNPDTITGNGTSFITQGFREGMKIVIANSENTGENDGIYTIASVTATVITLDSQDSLVTNTADTTATLDLVTDFTITNYTSGTPGRTGFIGLLWDREHADDRFAMLTPDLKFQNNDTVDNSGSNGAWDWWSYANSTGTTTAGTTDRVRSASRQEFSALRGEQIGTLCLVPLNNDNLWVGQSAYGRDGWSTTWGTATLVDDGQNAGYVGTGRVANNVLKSKTMDSGVLGVSTATNADVVTRINSTQLGSATTYDSAITAVFADRSDAYSANYEVNGGIFSYLGRGMFFGGKSGQPRGRFVYSFNADGTLTNEDALPYGFWQEYGWDGTRWVLDNAGTRTTHAQSSFSGTSVNINHTAGTIVGTGFASTDWAGDGFEAGDTITISSAEDTDNNGTYIVESLSGTTLTITPYTNTLSVTNTADTTAVIVGDRAIIDGLAVSFDDDGATNPLVLDEYYDVHLADSILSDNATNATWDTVFYETGTETGTTYESATVPASDVGAVTGELFSPMPVGPRESVDWWYEKPGRTGGSTQSGNSNLHFGSQQLGTTDWEMRWRVTGPTDTNEVRVGIVPWAGGANLGTAIGVTGQDWCVSVYYDPTNNPSCDVYTFAVHETGNGAVIDTTVTDRVVTIATQDETNFDGGASNGDIIIAGDGVGGNAYVVNDVITMDDGTTITVDAIDGNGDVTQFSVTTSSTASSERTERIIGSNDYTSLNFDTTGDTITRTGGTAFDTDGFLVGMKLIVDGSTNNDGVYTITDVTSTVITVAENLTTNASETPTYFGTGLYQTSVTPSAGRPTNFAITLGSNNEAAADLGNDQFFMKRVGSSTGNIRFGINGIERYRITSAYTLDVAPSASQVNSSNFNGTINDWEMDYTKNRRIVRIGNGSTTGASNPNFREIATAAITYNTSDWSLQLDGVEATILTDGSTSPAAGEVNVIRGSGELWFNSADAGKTITGNWRTVFGINNI